MLQVQSIDVSGVGFLANGIHHALIGTGNGGDLKDVITDETRKLALECGSNPTARQQKKMESFIRRDIGKVFIGRLARPFMGDKSKGNGITWLSAGPNFLAGVPDDRLLYNKVSLAGGGAKSILYGSRGKSFTQGPKWLDVADSHKGINNSTIHQHVEIANRFMVGRGVISGLFAALKKRIGIRDASFAETAQKLGESSLPQKTTAHFPTGHNVTKVLGLVGDNPEITFGSDAKGVAGLSEKVKKSVATRERKMRYRLNLILSGYAQDNSSGRTIRRHGK